MESKSFSAKIVVAKSPKEVFNCLAEVTKWWSKDFEGNSKNIHDEFVIHHPNAHYSKQKLIEVLPDEKIVWLVTDSTLYWLLKDKHEWTNTKMIFEISTNDNSTSLHFTHEGLVPEKECFTMCEMGWNIIIKNWLLHFINFGKESNEMEKSVEIRNQALEEISKLK